MFKRILIPLDGSALAANALKPAMRIAQAQEGETLLLRVVEPVPVMMGDAFGQPLVWPIETTTELSAAAQRYLDAVKEEWQPVLPKINTCVEVGTPANSIIGHAEQHDIDLIVMTTHGTSGIERWMMGSVAERVLRNAPCPVLILRGEESLTHMMITLDGSYLSEMVLEPALALASSLGARVTLLRVDDPREHPDMALYQSIASADDTMAERYRLDFYNQSQRYLQNVIDQYSDQPLEIKFDLGRGNAAKQIVQAAERDGCELIAMTTHGRTGLSRWRYGSTTEKVLRSAEKALFVVRPAPDDEAALGDVATS